MECNIQENKTLRFNFNDLFEKHKLCLQCIDSHKEEAHGSKKIADTFRVIYLLI